MKGAVPRRILQSLNSGHLRDDTKHPANARRYCHRKSAPERHPDYADGNRCAAGACSEAAENSKKEQ
jgi:hypothetical protein